MVYKGAMTVKKGVIYTRYSSDRQNEQSIDGQIEVCTKWAKSNDIEIVNIYRDEALTGKTDKRHGFQQMIKDAKSEKFDYIIVYKLDRFARNRYDSAIYKAQLKKYNVRVVSAMENISKGPEGIILESVLEGMAEYYSANLAQNVLRGMRQRAEQGKYLGGTIPLGYKIDSDNNYVIDESTAFIVKRIYEMYADGRTIKEICAELNAAGHKSATGKKFNYNSMHRLLTNRKYVGIYDNMDIVIENAIPRIIDNKTFEKVQRRMLHNKRCPSSSKSSANFYLTGKLFCGKCGSNMVGDSGTSSTGASHFYYSCIERKNRNNCTKKSIKKDLIEKIITDVTVNNVLTDENIEYLSQKAYGIYEKERNDMTEVNILKNNLKETQKIINNIMSAIEQGIITETTKRRLLEAENNKTELLANIAKEEIKRPPISKENICFFLNDVKNKVYNTDERTEIIIRTFVNAVYLYDDNLVITFNFREGESLKKLELSDLKKFGFDTATFTSIKPPKTLRFRGFFVFVSMWIFDHFYSFDNFSDNYRRKIAVNT